MSELVSAQVDVRANNIGANERKLLGQLDDLRKEGEEKKKEWLKKARTTTEQDLRLYRGEFNRKFDDTFFESNFTQAMIDRQVAQLTDNRPILRVDARKAGLKKMANALQHIIGGVWQESELQRQLFKMCHNSNIRKSAGMYTGYDASEDKIFFELLNIDQVTCSPEVTEAAMMDKAEYLHIERIQPLSKIKLLFPGRGALVRPDARLVGDAHRGGRTIDSPVTSFTGNQTIPATDVVPRARVWETFIMDRQIDANGRKLFPNGRRILYTEDVILYDQQNPYWDGRWPVDWYDWGVDPEHPWGHSGPSLVFKLQTSFNQLMDTLVENQIIANIFTIVGDNGALDEKQWQGLAKIPSTLIVRKRNRNDTITPVPPPPFGADRLAVGRMIFTMAQLIMGVTDVTLGETPGSLQSGLAIEGLQEGANLMTRARASRLEDFMDRVGNKAISRVLQFLESDRVFSMLGPTGGAIDYAFNRKELFVKEVGNDIEVPLTDEERRDVFRFLRFNVLPGSSAPGTRNLRARLMMDLVKIGAASRKALLEAADFPNADEMIDEAMQDDFVRAMLGLQTGAQGQARTGPPGRPGTLGSSNR